MAVESISIEAHQTLLLLQIAMTALSSWNAFCSWTIQQYEIFSGSDSASLWHSYAYSRVYIPFQRPNHRLQIGIGVLFTYRLISPDVPVPVSTVAVRILVWGVSKLLAADILRSDVDGFFLRFFRKLRINRVRSLLHDAILVLLIFRHMSLAVLGLLILGATWPLLMSEFSKTKIFSCFWQGLELKNTMSAE